MHRIAYMLAAVLLFGTMEAVSACTDRFLSYEELLAKASTVFIARIIRTEEAGTIREVDHLPPRQVVEATFRVMGVLKGAPPADGKVKGYARMHCNVPLLAGHGYAIFLYGDNFIASHHDGTTHLWHPENVDAKRLLEQLDEQEKEMKKRFQELVEGKGNDCYSRLSDEEAFARATTVFFGRLTRTEEVEVTRTSDAPSTPVVEATFKVLDVVKGQALAEVKARSVGVSKSCQPLLRDVDLLPGNDFLVYLDQANAISGGTWSPGRLGGKYHPAWAARYREKIPSLNGKAQ